MKIFHIFNCDIEGLLVKTHDPGFVQSINVFVIVSYRHCLTSAVHCNVSLTSNDTSVLLLHLHRKEELPADILVLVKNVFNKFLHRLQCTVDNLILLQFDTEFNETSSGLKPTDETQGSETDQEEIDPRPRTGSAGVVWLRH